MVLKNGLIKGVNTIIGNNIMLSFKKKICDCETNLEVKHIERLCCSLATVTYTCPKCGKRIKNIEYSLEDEK